jgi:uracil-DNA glycosylase
VTLLGTATFVPQRLTLPVLRDAAQLCKGCDLYLHATQAVIGEGPKSSHLMMVGEQPGNHEDLQGHPFVGPAGKLLDRVMVEAGLNRADVFVTNAVKHFKFEERGKRRLHKEACRYRGESATEERNLCSIPGRGT